MSIHDNPEEAYQAALAVIKREGKVSTSLIQRHLVIGYSHAARIMEQLEENGVISKQDHVGLRKIL